MGFCEDCPIRSRSVPARGHADAKLVIVGESPGKNEVVEQRPFIGKSGKYLKEAMDRAGLHLDSCYITNAIKCLPPASKKRKDKILNDAVKACHPHLTGELAQAPRKLILAFGNAAVRSLTGNYRFSITKGRGEVIQTETADIGILPTYHPAHVLRNEGLHPQFMADLVKARKLLAGEGSHDVEAPPYKVLSLEECLRLEDFLVCEDKVVACDIETTGLDIHNDEFCLMGVCDGEMTYIADEPVKAKAVLQSLARGRYKTVWHNGKFDRAFLMEQVGATGREARVFEDTMLESYALDENTGRHGLEQCVIDHLGLPGYKHEDTYGLSYLAKDCQYTLGLHHHLRPQVAADPDLERHYTTILVPAANALVSIERAGMPVFQDNVKTAKHDLEARVEPLLANLKIQAGDEKFNPNSWQQVMAVLNGRGLKPPDTSKETLEEYAGDTFVDTILEYRKLNKLLSTYISRFDAESPKTHIKPNGRIYTTYGQHQSVTGRLASSPNLQNLPKLKAVKNMISVRHLTNRVLLELDYSQAELRSLAVLSGDEALIDVFRRGDDLHSAVAREMFGASFNDFQRRVAKTINFGIVYGMGAATLAARMGISAADAQSYINAWFGRFPKAHIFILKCRRSRELTTVYGRKRRIHVVTDQNRNHIENQMGNFPHQSMCADFTTEAQIVIAGKINRFDGYPLMINDIHDALLFEIENHQKIVRKFALWCQEVMEKIPRKRINPPFSFRVDCEVGLDWGEMMPLNEFFA